MAMVEMRSHLAIERARLVTLHLKQARRSSIPTARRRKPDTAKANLEPRFAVSGGQGVHREVESEGHEEIVSRRRRIASCCAKDEGGPLETAL